MFTRLELKNFRAFEKVELDLSPITILVGPNNSGKSSIVSGLRILAQTMHSEDYRIPLALKGLYGDFGTYKDVVFQNEKRRRISICVGILSPRRTQSKEAKFELSFAYRSQRREVILSDSIFEDDSGRRIVTRASASDPSKHYIEIVTPRNGQSSSRVRKLTARMFHFVPRLFPSGGRGNWEDLPPEQMRFVLNADTAASELMRSLRSVEYLGPFRAEPQRTNLFSGESPTTVGRDGAKAIDMLASDYLRRGRRKKQLLNHVVEWLRKASVARDFKVRLLGDRHYEILIQHPVTGEFKNLADVGYGNSQVLPVIAGGFNLPPESTFIVEQPELHLHPKAQSELGDFVLQMYDRHIQCILETHSEHLILRLQKHVALGRIPPRDVSVYYVHALPAGKTISKLTLRKDGLFDQEWPEGFFEERLKEVTDIAKAPFLGAAS